MSYFGFQIRYTDSNGYTQTASTYSYYTRTNINRYTLNYLQLEEEYEISVRAYFEFSGCYSYIYSAYSDNVTATTMETGDFHDIDSVVLTVNLNELMNH